MKDHIRDYATEAFRFYAKWGSKDNYVKYLLDDLRRQKGTGICSPTEAVLIHKEQVMREYTAEIADLEAAETVLKICGRDIRRAVEIVYLDKPFRDLEWGDIKERVHYAELTVPASERQIYYWLKKARYLFAEERGLRLKDVDKRKIEKMKTLQ